MPSENKLSVVGIGPGALDQMTCKGDLAIRQARFVVGHKTYIDQVRGLLEKQGQEIIPSGMGREVERAKLAIDLLEEGSVALISGGDPNVYGMAGLSLEIASGAGSLNSVEVVPGVTTFTAAASRAGVAFRRSVAVISLSDLLTPWEDIKRRAELPAKLGYPVAIYNPKSRRRDWQLGQILKIFEDLGRASDPVLIAKNVTRPSEKLHWTTVGGLMDSDDQYQGIDMFTLLLIGGRGMTKGGIIQDESNVHIIGIGPGDSDHLTKEATALLKRSHRIFGAERYLRQIKGISSAETIRHEGKYDRRMDASFLAAIEGPMSSILVGGDPCVFSSAWRVLERSAEHKKGVHISPGIGAFSAVAARAGAPLVSDFVLLSGISVRADSKIKSVSRATDQRAIEKRSLEQRYEEIYELVKAGFGVVVYNTNLDDIKGLLEIIGESDAPSVLAQDVFRPEERVVVAKASELAEEAAFVVSFMEKRSTLILGGASSYIDDGKIITRRGYDTKYSY